MGGKREKEDPPQICERGWDGNANHGEYTSMCQVGISVRMSWQASFFSPPSTPAHAQNTLLPCLEHMVHQQRHLAALTPGSCASSLPVGSLGTATSSTTCGSSRVRRRAMNYFEVAAVKLTFIQEIHNLWWLQRVIATHVIMLGWQSVFPFSSTKKHLVNLHLIPCFSRRWRKIYQCFYIPYAWICKWCEHDPNRTGNSWKLNVFVPQWPSSGNSWSVSLCHWRISFLRMKEMDAAYLWSTCQCHVILFQMARYFQRYSQNSGFGVCEAVSLHLLCRWL